jgi:hypothetical protein
MFISTTSSANNDDNDDDWLHEKCTGEVAMKSCQNMEFYVAQTTKTTQEDDDDDARCTWLVTLM